MSTEPQLRVNPTGANLREEASAKALQVYAQSRGDAPDTVVMDAAERKAANPVRRVLLD